MRTPIIAGNWKMHKTVGEATEMVRKLDELVADSPVEVVICAPFTSLASLSLRIEQGETQEPRTCISLNEEHLPA